MGFRFLQVFVHFVEDEEFSILYTFASLVGEL